MSPPRNQPTISIIRRLLWRSSLKNETVRLGLAYLRCLDYVTVNHPTRRLTYVSRLNVCRWHFAIALDLADRRHSDSDHAAPAQLYRGNLPHHHRISWRLPPVRKRSGSGGPLAAFVHQV